VKALDIAGSRGWHEAVPDLEDAEMVELGQHAGQITAVTTDVAPPRRALCAGASEHLRNSIACVLIESTVGHLEVQAAWAAVFHARP
jgi:hypothetical protein